ncbi:MAG: PAAR domain-containing protein [Planctomycetota bacterium]
MNTDNTVTDNPPPPGTAMPAARLGDVTAHGGTIGPVTTGLAASVFIGNQPAACVGDPHVCPMFCGPKPHTGGTITMGSATVMIAGKPAARVSDLTVCSPEPGQIAMGESTVFMG